jgi:hypothetical protein
MKAAYPFFSSSLPIFVGFYDGTGSATRYILFTELKDPREHSLVNTGIW